MHRHSADSTRLETAIELDDEEKQVSTEDGEDEAFLESAEKDMGRTGGYKPGFMKMDLKTYYRYVMDELPSEARYGFALLALFYVLINNTVSIE